MPRFADLDEDQRKIYQGAPPDGSVLVVGPPGTGKTVMAFHRATYLKKLGQSPRAIMFNSVLAKYTIANNTHAKGIKISTMHSWVSEWFRVMRAGSPPRLEPYVYDWNSIARIVKEVASDGRAGAANWGHLVVDEGQDFAPEMYIALALLLSGKWAGGQAPALSVFADENQRLTRTNATIAQIQAALALVGEKRVFGLTRNYRNTEPIARFAAHYYCGLRSGIAAFPKKRGSPVSVSFHRGQPAMVEAIIAIIEEARDRELDVGIVCPRDRTRRYVVRQLEEHYEEDGDLVIQTYSARDNDLRAEDLEFDQAGTVTVLCRPSVKGLEFDVVVVVDPLLEKAADASGEQQFKMNMYVACSRAREQLYLCFVSDRDKVERILPPKNDSIYRVEG